MNRDLVIMLLLTTIIGAVSMVLGWMPSFSALAWELRSFGLILLAIAAGAAFAFRNH
jgi:hypothetical protein